MKKNYFLLTAVALLFSVQATFAQNRGNIIDVNQVLVASGGAFSNPDDYVTIGTYNPLDSVTTEFNTIFTQSVQCAVVFDHFLYVAAQDSIVAYDIDSYERVAAIGATGVNQLAATNDKLIASFWYPDTSDFVRIYNRSDLMEQAVISDVTDEAAGIAVFNNKAYVAVPGGWAATTGKLAVINLESNTFEQEIDLGAEGSGISNVYVYKDNGNHYLITVNKTAWGGTSGYVSKIDLSDMSVTNAAVNVVIGKGVELVNSDATLYALINGGIGSINLSDLTVADTSIVAPPDMTIAGAALDTINNKFYVTTTDYATFGDGTIYNMDGVATGSFDAGISAEAVAIDYRDYTGVNETSSPFAFSIYPNPAGDNISVSIPNGSTVSKLFVSDLTGRVVVSERGSFKGEFTINLSGLVKGLYLVIVKNGNKLYTTKIVKQ